MIAHTLPERNASNRVLEKAASGSKERLRRTTRSSGASRSPVRRAVRERRRRPCPAQASRRPTSDYSLRGPPKSDQSFASPWKEERDRRHPRRSLRTTCRSAARAAEPHVMHRHDLARPFGAEGLEAEALAFAFACQRRSAHRSAECRLARHAAPPRRTSDSARRCPLRSAALATGGDDPAARLRRELTNLKGATRPTRSPATRTSPRNVSDPADNARRIVDALERG